MYTRCPKCSTCFRVTERHLAIAKGKVRCGQCQHVFNAPEHAIDDLPVNPTPPQTSNKPVPAVTPTAKTEPSVEKEKPQAPKVKKSIDEAAVVETAEIKISTTKTTLTDTQQLKADTTKRANIDINAPSDKQKNINEEDDLFDDSFDLNAAIDELNEAAEHEAEVEITSLKDEIAAKSEQYVPEVSNNEDVFNTGAYDESNASSVADIMNEMEGQLSLNIPEPKDNEKYDVNNEFEFLELDNEIEQEKEETNDQTLANFFDIDELEELNTENDSIKKEQINEDELFNHVDLSDVQDSEVSENIILDESHSKNIGQHAADDENDIPFQLRNDLGRLQSPTQRRFHPLFSFSFIIILLALSFAQLAYFRTHELVELIPSTRPLLENFCKTVHCHYSGPRDTNQIQLISRDVRLHPKEKKALLISAAMINNAYFAQPYPNIHIRLSDISGNVVAERIFNAKTYMGKLSNPFLLMKSKTPVHINFEVVDPGKDAINFEFTFL
jgi:predicted Zn finger-like uncharacterized protein